MIALDTETLLIDKGFLAPPLVCVQLWTGDRGTILHRTENWQKVVKSCPALVGQNMAYDMAVMASTDPAMTPWVFQMYAEDRVTCTQVRQKLIDIANGHRKYEETEDGTKLKTLYSLAAMAKKYLGRELDKDTVRLRYHEMWNIPVTEWPAAFSDYALSDAQATFDLWKVQEESAQFLADQYRQARAAFWIHLMAAWGIRTDLQAVRDLEYRLVTDHAKVAEELLHHGLLRKYPKGLVRNTKIAQGRIVVAYAGTDVPMTDGGKPSTSREACQNSGDPVLGSYAEYAKINAMITKDIPALAKGCQQHAIHSRFDSLVDSGRTSSSGPNIQNLKTSGGVRECFVPRPGHVFVCTDYGGLELCTLAEACIHLLGRSTLAEIINAGRDAHLVMASHMLSADYDEIKGVWDYGKKHPEYQGIWLRRQTGKVANFGFPGGLGAGALCHFAKQIYGVDLTVKDAKALKATWYRMLPEMPDYFRMVDRQITGQSFPWVKQIYSDRVRGGLRYTEACNTYFQGLGADLAKDAGWRIAREMYDPTLGSVLLGARTVNFVHDEFVVECLEEKGHEVAMRVQELMLQAAAVWIPHVKIKAEPIIQRRYGKADQTWQNGRLVCSA